MSAQLPRTAILVLLTSTGIASVGRPDTIHVRAFGSIYVRSGMGVFALLSGEAV